VILPAVVPTAIATPEFFRDMPKKNITPMTSIIKTYDTLIDDNEMSGQCIEVSGEELHYRKQMEYANDSQRFLFTDYLPKWKAMFAKKLGYEDL
jgi:15-hydroxyprostaglandin dehydrogenase (NAD)